MKEKSLSRRTFVKKPSTGAAGGALMAGAIKSFIATALSTFNLFALPVFADSDP